MAVVNRKTLLLRDVAVRLPRGSASHRATGSGGDLDDQGAWHTQCTCELQLCPRFSMIVALLCGWGEGGGGGAPQPRARVAARRGGGGLNGCMR